MNSLIKFLTGFHTDVHIIPSLLGVCPYCSNKVSVSRIYLMQHGSTLLGKHYISFSRYLEMYISELSLRSTTR